MSNVPLFLGTDFSYIVLAVVFFWIGFGIRTFLQYRRKWAREKGSLTEAGPSPHAEEAQTGGKTSPAGAGEPQEGVNHSQAQMRDDRAWRGLGAHLL